MVTTRDYTAKDKTLKNFLKIVLHNQVFYGVMITWRVLKIAFFKDAQFTQLLFFKRSDKITNDTAFFFIQ